MTDSPVGIIAGSGRLPHLVADRLHDRGDRVLICSISRENNGELKQAADRFYSVEPADFGSIPELLRTNGVKELLMVGDVDKTQLYDSQRLNKVDDTVKRELKKLTNKGDQKIIKAAARLLRLQGLKVIGVNEVLDNFLTPRGHIAGPPLTGEDEQTLEVLENLAVKLADEEVGQAVIGKKQSVVAVEAAEGTDRLISRAGELAGEGCV
ncbi:MAG: UDP-2,3-diacylglucosamine diphosphatase LpxI domain-containing protein, partial [bacterium]